MVQQTVDELVTNRRSCSIKSVSRTSTSFVNLFSIRPIGVISINHIGVFRSLEELMLNSLNPAVLLRDAIRVNKQTKASVESMTSSTYSPVYN